MKQTFLRQQLAVLGLLSMVILNLVGHAAQAGKEFSLPALQKDIESRYDGVAHITAKQLAKQIEKTPESVVMFDVREIAEYNVSHIPGAIQVAPNIWHSPFMKKYAAQLKGKTVIFYCSVGVRSSKLARYVQKAAIEAGATRVLNLQYGVFGWHNEARPLVDNNKATRLVHPYDKHWGQLVTQNNLTSYKPAK